MCLPPIAARARRQWSWAVRSGRKNSWLFLIQAPRPEALLPAPVGVGRFVIRATQRAWGWRAAQSELGDGIS
jgi:hypothetical protein